MAYEVDNFLSGLLPGEVVIESVAILDQDYKKVFTDAKIMDVRVKEDSRTMEHPIESGAVITDHRIILPVEIEMTLMLNSANYSNLYLEIRQNFLDSTLFIIQTKAGVYENQMMTSLPRSENAEVFNGTVLILNFRQVLFVTASVTFSPKNNSDSNTVNRGTQQGITANGNQTAKATSGLVKVS